MYGRTNIETHIPDMPMHRFILDRISKFGDDIAFIDNTTKQKLSFRQVSDGTKLLATSLFRHGVRKGDIVGIVSETTASYSLVSMAIMACGAIASPCNPLYTKEEMRHQYAHSEAKFMICSKLCMPVFTQIAQNLPNLKKMFTFQKCSGYICIEELINSGSMNEYPPPVSIDPINDIALLPYSSGTTGLSKGVMLTHRNLVAIGCTFNRGHIQRSDIGYGVLPAFHLYGFAMQFVNLIAGAVLVTDARFDFKTMLEVIEREKVSYLLLVPPLMVLIAKSMDVAKYDVSSVRKIITGAAPLAASLADDVVKKMKNVNITQAYGLTECCPVTMGMYLESPVTSIGFATNNIEIRIVDPETGKDAEVGEVGELLTRGPQVMKGYFKNPEATRRAINKEGWFHTGDIGYVDKLGYYYIVDRLKELIKYKGFQVPPAELEEILLRHPDVADAAVIGVPDTVAGELPKAFVVRKNAMLTEKEIEDFVKGKVSRYKELKGGVEFIVVIPKSASGKILRRFLRNKVKSKL